MDEYFGGKKGGFFIEAGAWNGVYLSNSLWLEMERNWTGLLVEANGKAYKELTAANRKAYSFNGCLSLKGIPERVIHNSKSFVGFHPACFDILK